jgi:hypothetical protein
MRRDKDGFVAAVQRRYRERTNPPRS